MLWRDVVGYEGLYRVSDTGVVESVTRYVRNGLCEGLRAGEVLKARVYKPGYLAVKLTKDKVKKHKLVHRLVAEAFCPNPQGKPVVTHLDGNKVNNHAPNLEWVTKSENCIHAVENGLVKILRGKDSPNYNRYRGGNSVRARPVKHRDTGKEYGAITEAVEDLKISKTTARRWLENGRLEYIDGRT